MKRVNVKGDKFLTLRNMTVIGVLGGISVMLGMTPLGFIPIGPTKATIMHIPVIIGSILEGPIVGSFIGFIFGVFSIFQAITSPTPVSFVFYNPLISILPRVVMGFGTYYIYRLFKDNNSKLTKGILNLLISSLILYLGINLVDYGSILNLVINIGLIFLLCSLIYSLNKLKGEAFEITLAAGLGSLINTVGVLGGIYLIYGEKYMVKLGKSVSLARKFILGVAITNGIPEVILAIIITFSVVRALKNTK